MELQKIKMDKTAKKDLYFQNKTAKKSKWKNCKKDL